MINVTESIVVKNMISVSTHASLKMALLTNLLRRKIVTVLDTSSAAMIISLYFVWIFSCPPSSVSIKF